MPLLVSEAIVLHAFDYLESSRIVRLVTRDAGMRSAIAKGARKSRRRFGSGLDLFGQGTASLHTRPGRELDTLTGFEDVRARDALAEDLERFTGAEAIAEIVLRFGREGGDAELFDALAGALDALLGSSQDVAREATLAGAWRVIGALGFGPAMEDCAECGGALDAGAPATFTHSAGGVLCARCASLTAGGRTLPPDARRAIASWIAGNRATLGSEREFRAHQRLLREFLAYHLHDGRPLRAFDLWEQRLAAPLAATAAAAANDALAE